MADDIRGKRALVTGSAQGLGKDIAIELAKAGCHVIVNCFHHPERAEAVRDEIISRGGDASIFVCDITKEDELRTLDVDILVNNARLDPYKRPAGFSDGEWFHALLDVKLIGAYLCTLAASEKMKERRWGRVLNISSVQAHLGMCDEMLPYAVSNAAMNSLTRCFAKMLGEWNITVNTLAPGMVITENLKSRLSQEEIDRRLSNYPLHRAATGHEIAEQAVNVIRCGAMTGETVNINSGIYFSA